MEAAVIYLFAILCIQASSGLEDGCNGEMQLIAVRGKGQLLSPGFAKNKPYPDNVNCQHQLQAPTGMSLRLHFNELDIDATESCGADNLRIFDFNSAGQGFMIGMYCGKFIPHDYVSSSNFLQLHFRSDEFANSRGYNVTYSLSATSAVCSQGEIQCRNRNCVKNSVKCDGVDNCGDGTDEEKCGFIPAVSTCGKPEIEPKTYSDADRIVGGDSAIYGSWPWMADLQMNIVEPNGHICGGTLINAQWVLTAAHCFGQMRRASDFRVHLGNFRKFERDPYEQIRFVERLIIFDDIPENVFVENGEYDIVNDMALMKLNAPVKFTKYVKPICLPDSNIRLNSTSKCYATGWGMTRGSGYSERLKQASHPIQSDNTCARLVGRQFVSATMICAGSLGPKKGVCHGDSGGPLVCERNKIWEIVGVASYVTDTNFIDGLCGLSGRPSVFNKVSVKLDWIAKILRRYA